MQDQIVYEDNHLVIINKKVGQLVQNDKTKDEPLVDALKSYIKERDHKPGNVFIGVVHRLDRPTTGLVMFAKTSKALSRVTKMIKDREIKKTYWAAVSKELIPQEATLINYLRKNEKQNKSYAYDEEVTNSKRAVLHYKIIKPLDRYNVLEIDLETGRHHQIRAQLAKIGVFIRGDVKYGASRPNPDAGINLHARKLEFIHPVTKALIQVVAPLPPDDPVWQATEE